MKTMYGQRDAGFFGCTSIVYLSVELSGNESKKGRSSLTFAFSLGLLWSFLYLYL